MKAQTSTILGRLHIRLPASQLFYLVPNLMERVHKRQHIGHGIYSAALATIEIHGGGRLRPINQSQTESESACGSGQAQLSQETQAARR